jgi:two-component system, NarL family, sensor histidine kinase UhpB
MQSNKEAYERFEALSNATNDAIWDYDMVNETIFYNERVEKIFGYSKVELKNNTIWWESNIHKEDKDRVLKKMNHHLENNTTVWEDEYRFKAKNGEYKNVYDRSYIQRDDAGKPIRLIGAMKDNSAFRSMEAELNNQRLGAKNDYGKNIILFHEMEKKKIKNDLHEDVNQLLATVKLNLSKLKHNPTVDAQELQATILYLEEAIHKINNISGKLSSATFELFGLAGAIEAIVNKYNEKTKNNIELEITNFNTVDIDNPLALLIYRIVEDKLNRLVTSFKTTLISIKLFSANKKQHIQIIFETEKSNTASLLIDKSLINAKSKLSMYEGKMGLKNVGENKYLFEVVV